MATSDYTSKDIARFWSKVKISSDTQTCWEWQAGKIEGYGSIRINGKNCRAHRFSWLIAHGDPGKLHVLHTCDNPACVNPNHLFLGTHLQNMQDKHAKGRDKWSRTHRSKLSIEQKDYIQERYARGGITFHELADEMGITTRYVSLIIVKGRLGRGIVK